MPTSESTTSEKTVLCRGERFSIYLDEATIQARIQEIGQEINTAYEGKTPIFIGVLNGSFMFLADLMRAVEIDCEVDFWKLSSYGAEKVSSGKVTELKKVDAQLEGRHVIIVEDIVDTGLSMQYILDRMRAYNPASIRVATLLHKPEATTVDVQLDYVGFSIPKRFVLGYGLDFGQLGRNLREIYIQDEGHDNGEER
ncbi:MAG TPA: hypoxanthine phosphoribosyltransferase [Rhodothermales bacterium]|nr:hypoxanthine phosphoribosyltransferase [Rhodothermales bacterium]